MDQTIIIAGAFGAVAGLVWLLAMSTNPRAGLIAIALMVFLASIGVALNWRGNIYGSWLLPVQMQRSMIFLLVGVVLAIGMAAHLPRVQFGKLSAGAVLLVIIGCYIGLARTIHEGPIDGLQTIALALIVLTALVITVAHAVETGEDLYPPIRMIAVGLGMFLFCVAMQVARDRSRIMNDSDRFIGVGSNPQIVATFLALSLVPVAWLLMYDRANRYRPLWWGIAAFGSLALLATGSRTGLAMTMLGLGTIFVRRFGRAILAVPIGAFAVYVGLNTASAIGLELPLSRLTSTENTRSQAWAFLLEQFRANPLIGTGREGAEVSENSYLYGAAAYGIGMLALLLTFTAYSVWNMMRLFWRTRSYPQLHSVVDLIIAIHVMYFAGAVFEGYMISRVSAPLPIILVAISMGGAIMFQLDQQDAGVLHFVDEDDDDGEDVDEAWYDDDDPDGMVVWDDDVHDEEYADAYQS